MNHTPAEGTVRDWMLSHTDEILKLNVELEKKGLVLEGITFFYSKPRQRIQGIPAGKVWGVPFYVEEKS